MYLVLYFYCVFSTPCFYFYVFMFEFFCKNLVLLESILSAAPEIEALCLYPEQAAC